MSKYDDYEMTIGIECHVQLNTRTKLFGSSNNDAREAEPNTTVDHIDWALPGMLPVLNKQAIVLAVKAAKALGAEVNPVSRFDRKHYFYPDLPKGYQTSQFYQPIIGPGKVRVDSEEGEFEVRIEHAHLEEDAGKLTHSLTHSLIDLNRAGTPLIEIVTMPDIHSAKQAKAFASELHKLMVFSGVTIGDLYHGNMRFDVNVSVAKKGSDKLGTRAEIKNLNSFRSVEKAAEYEFYRQIDELEAGRNVVQETRGFDEAKQKTFSQRSKEEAQDYRYMPDPDIPPIVLSKEDIQKMQADMPKLPSYYRQLFHELGLDKTVVDALLSSRQLCEFVERIKSKSNIDTARRITFWFVMAINEQIDDNPLIREDGSLIEDDYFVQLSKMVDSSELSSSSAKEIFKAMQSSGDEPLKIAKSMGLIQVNDGSAIEAIVDEILETDQGKKALTDVKSGNQKAVGFIVGQAMKLSKGQANPQMVQNILNQKLKEN